MIRSERNKAASLQRLLREKVSVWPVRMRPETPCSSFCHDTRGAKAIMLSKWVDLWRKTWQESENTSKLNPQRAHSFFLQCLWENLPNVISSFPSGSPNPAYKPVYPVTLELPFRESYRCWKTSVGYLEQSALSCALSRRASHWLEGLSSSKAHIQ